MAPSLPVRPNLEWLRKTAKDRLVELRATDPSAKLADAQLAVAREYGFASWRRLKAHVERAADPNAHASESLVRAFLDAVGNGLLDDVRARLDADPTLVRAVGPHPFWGGCPQALHLAVEGRRRDMFDLLLAAGADVDGSNDGYDHWSPLMLAIDRGADDMRDELLRRGAKIGLVEALMLEDDARVDELVRDSSLPLACPNGGSILAFARTPFALDRLLELGVPTQVTDRWGSTPMDALSRLGPRGQRLVEHLVSRGLPAAPADHARVGDAAMLARLVAADPAVAARDDVLMAAVDFGHLELVEWLLAHGGSLNARSANASRHTALHSAAWNGDLRMVTLLVEAGADPSVRDQEHDNTALGWAETSIKVTNNPKCAEVAAYLREVTPGRSG